MQTIAPNVCSVLYLNFTIALSCGSMNLHNKMGAQFGSKLLKGLFLFNPIRSNIFLNPSNADEVSFVTKLETSLIA